MSYGLLGEKLSHSYSPELHKMLGRPDYRLFEIAPEALSAFMEAADFDGINVTVPYKKAVIPYLSELSPEAEAAGSVNCIVKRADGTLYGDNTDTKGFEALLDFSGIAVKGKKVLVLGSGGAAGAVTYVLKKRRACPVTVSRSGEVNYENVYSQCADADVIVNATPVGMYPGNGVSPVNIAPFEKLSGVIDLIYNPDKTALVLDAEDRGIKAVGGLYMLAAQGVISDGLFSGKNVQTSKIGNVYSRLRSSRRNIVLIGMPGSGKTVICKRLSAALNRPFEDVDRTIEKAEGCRITDIFAEKGEDYFRARETEITRELCRGSGKVISTGGGVVTRPENRRSLRENSVIIYLIRSTSALTQRNRPVFSATDPEELAKIRVPLYKEWADVKILNSGIGPTVGEIIRFLHLKPEEKEK